MDLKPIVLYTIIMSLHELPGNQPWVKLFQGFDSTVYTDPQRQVALHAYPRYGQDEVEMYADLTRQSAGILTRNFVRRHVGQFPIPFTLKDVVAVESVVYNNELRSWTTLSPFVTGPNLSSLNDPAVFHELCAGLAFEEQEALTEFFRQYNATPRYGYELQSILKTATNILVAKTKNPGIDLILENTKLRYEADKKEMRLVVTDLSPSLERIFHRTSQALI